MKMIRKICALFSMFVCLNIAGQNSSNNDILSDSATFAEFIYLNIHYPMIDFVNGMEDTAVYRLETDSAGRIDKIQAVRITKSVSLNWESERLIRKTQQIPMQNCRENSIYEITIRFNLSDNKIYKMSEVEDMPEFSGGAAEMLKFIGNNLHFTPEAAESAISGTIYCGVVIEKDGTVGMIEILRSIYSPIDAEVVRVIKRMPKWKAGKKDGKSVRVYLMLPVKIGLN